MHNVKNNVKQLLMPWKRKLAEIDGEEVQNNDDFGTHPVLQVRNILFPCTDACGACRLWSLQIDSSSRKMTASCAGSACQMVLAMSASE